MVVKCVGSIVIIAVKNECESESEFECKKGMRGDV